MTYVEKLTNWIEEEYGEWLEKIAPSPHDLELSETMKFSMYALAGYYEVFCQNNEVSAKG